MDFSNSTSTAVARLQIAVEIDLSGEHFGERHRELDRLARGVDCRDNGRMLAVDAAANRHSGGLLVVEKHASIERLRS